MEKPKIPQNEEFRLTCLNEINILDTPPDPVYDKITQIVSEILDVPICLVSIVDNERQWFKSKVGLDATETAREISFCGHVVFSNEYMIVENALEDERFSDNPLVTAGPEIRFYAGMPLTVLDGVTLGTLCIIDMKPRKLSKNEINILKKFSEIIIEVFKKERVSLTDHLTGLYNRKMFDNVGKKLISNYKRNASEFSLISFDIDYFKKVNDTYGHDTGDVVLKKLSSYVLSKTREQDYLFRIGGEEFSILIPDMNLPDSTKYAERIRRSIESLQIEDKNITFNITCSIGVATYDESDINISSLLKRADKALYLAKEAGRNTVKSN